MDFPQRSTRLGGRDSALCPSSVVQLCIMPRPSDLLRPLGPENEIVWLRLENRQCTSALHACVGCPPRSAATSDQVTSLVFNLVEAGVSVV